jgi:hypothetical protein
VIRGEAIPRRVPAEWLGGPTTIRTEFLVEATSGIRDAPLEEFRSGDFGYALVRDGEVVDAISARPLG